MIDSINLRVLSTFETQRSYYTLAAYPPNASVLIAVYDSPSQSQYLTAYDPLSGAARGRVKIGAATAVESSAAYSALVQRFERGLLFAGAPANQVFVLYSDGKWE